MAHYDVHFQKLLEPRSEAERSAQPRLPDAGEGGRPSFLPRELCRKVMVEISRAQQWPQNAWRAGPPAHLRRRAARRGPRPAASSPHRPLCSAPPGAARCYDGRKVPPPSRLLSPPSPPVQPLPPSQGPSLPLTLVLPNPHTQSIFAARDLPGIREGAARNFAITVEYEGFKKHVEVVLTLVNRVDVAGAIARYIAQGARQGGAARSSASAAGRGAVQRSGRAGAAPIRLCVCLRASASAGSAPSRLRWARRAGLRRLRPPPTAPNAPRGPLPQAGRSRRTRCR